MNAMGDETFDDYYDILKISPAATEEDIKHAYRQAINFWHTDRYNSRPEEYRREAHRMTIKLNQAYEILSSPERRAAYDELHAQWKAYKEAEAAQEAVDSPTQWLGGGLLDTFCAKDDDLIAFLRTVGLEIIDKRPQGGALWVVGDHHLSNLFKQLGERGYHFVFTPRGGNATKRRPAWYLRK